MLPDIAKKISRGKPLSKVGIDTVHVYRTDFNDRNVLTNQGAYISLNNTKGAHMSRLVEVLKRWKNNPIEVDDEILDQLYSTHQSRYTYWECAWQSMYDIDDIQDLKIELKLEGKKILGQYRWYLSLGIPYASVCPCASAMCEDADRTGGNAGFPHMQRALSIITGEVNHDCDLEDFIPNAVSKVISVVDIIPMPYMKRADELDWCQRASKTRLFVEDATREISDVIEPLFLDSVVVCKHFESIHEHNVVGVRNKGEELV
jgi:GTP cyclohydrolase FolE2